MKIAFPAQAVWLNKKDGSGRCVVLKEADSKYTALIQKLFAKKDDWEKRNNKEYYLHVELNLQYQKRTFRQNSAVWVLVTAIFQSMEGRLPDEEEKYSLYLDLLEEYADKVQGRFGKLRPAHISESNSLEGARFIDGLLYHLATMCELDYGAQTSVIEVMQEWIEWRGALDKDPADYTDLQCSEMAPLEVWKEKRPYSEASGRGGAIVRAHIVSQGADAADIEKSWNWVALTWEEHQLQHDIGWDEFLRIYPHLKGRVERAFRLAGHRTPEHRANAGEAEHTAESLAALAMGDD
jgi:hypothetical protein